MHIVSALDDIVSKYLLNRWSDDYKLFSYLQKQLAKEFYKKSVHKDFNKVAGFRPVDLLKRDFDTGVFLWLLQKFQE